MVHKQFVLVHYVFEAKLNFVYVAHLSFIGFDLCEDRISKMSKKQVTCCKMIIIYCKSYDQEWTAYTSRPAIIMMLFDFTM